jgi:FSR family fosmidomycin resistance protein-like MFS transporter
MNSSQVAAAKTVFPVVLAVSIIHMLNDTMQIVVPAIVPLLRETLTLSYTQIGLILFALNMTSSIFQPVVGYFSDRRPSPILLPLGMCMSFLGIVGIAFATNFVWLIFAVIMIGFGSAVFHPEGSKVVYFSAGNRRGLAQSIYQVGGNSGSSTGPLMTKFLFFPFGQLAALWFTIVAALAVVISFFVSKWYRLKLQSMKQEVSRVAQGSQDSQTASPPPPVPTITPRIIWVSMFILILLTFARSTYHAAIGNYYQYYYADFYSSTVQLAQIPLFLFGLLGVAGTFIGGPLADRYGAKHVIFGSMAGSAPLTLLLPYVSQAWVAPLLMLIGFVMMVGFSVVVVYAQQLLPNYIGTATGFIVGLAFGMGALGAVALGFFIDQFGLKSVMVASSMLPLIGVLTYKLPHLPHRS